MTNYEFKIEHIKQRALEANLYIVDPDAELLSFKTYEDNEKDDRIVLSNITIDEAMTISSNGGFYKAKYGVIKSVMHFDVELVLTNSTIEDCYTLRHFGSGFFKDVLKDTSDVELIQIWSNHL